MIKTEIERFKRFKKIKLIDFIAYSIVLSTLILSYFNISFVGIFVWQLTFGTIGVLLELMIYNENLGNNFFKSFSRFTFIAVFLYFLISKFQFLK